MTKPVTSVAYCTRTCSYVLLVPRNNLIRHTVSTNSSYKQKKLLSTPNCRTAYLTTFCQKVGVLNNLSQKRIKKNRFFFDVETTFFDLRKCNGSFGASNGASFFQNDAVLEVFHWLTHIRINLQKKGRSSYFSSTITTHFTKEQIFSEHS